MANKHHLKTNVIIYDIDRLAAGLLVFCDNCSNKFTLSLYSSINLFVLKLVTEITINEKKFHFNCLSLMVSQYLILLVLKIGKKSSTVGMLHMVLAILSLTVPNIPKLN